jgi:hypothetical protein
MMILVLSLVGRNPQVNLVGSRPRLWTRHGGLGSHGMEFYHGELDERRG